MALRRHDAGKRTEINRLTVAGRNSALGGDLAIVPERGRHDRPTHAQGLIKVLAAAVLSVGVWVDATGAFRRPAKATHHRRRSAWGATGAARKSDADLPDPELSL